MVAIITGKGAGLERSSGWILGSQGQLGSAALGRANDNVFVNAANGNLVISRQDEFLIGRGPDVSIDRTYNSQAVAGVTDGDNDDNWRMGVYRRIDGTNGAATIKRIDWDGSDTVYEMVSANLYRTKDGSGAHDKLAWTGTEWKWTDGDSQLTDTYDSTGKLVSSSDTDGNSLTYIYTAGLITKVTGANGEHTDLVYSGTQLQQLTTYGTGPTPLMVRVRYGYDLADRLATVTVDLSPNDRSIDDDNTYVTSYTYDGESNRIASISQEDGSRVSFTYALVGADYRVASFTQTVETGITRTTGFDYSVAGRTTVTDPSGRNTILFYDAAKNLTQISYPPEEAGATPKVVQFAYDGDGNLATATLGPGDVITYGYDAAGNMTSERDSAGNTVTRTYGAKNEIITETKYLVPDPDGAGAGQPGTPIVTRYAYDSHNHLRYAVSAEGVVVQHTYNAAGQHTASVEFTAQTYTTAGAIDEGLLNDWVALIGDKSTTRRTETAYNFRGAIESVTSWSKLLPSGAFDTGSERSQTTYVHDQAGNLLTRQVTGSAGSEVFVYDGLNRTIMATDFNAAVTRTTFFDALGRTVIGHANGLNEILTYNRAGELIAFSQSNAGANMVELSGWPADTGNVPTGNASLPGWLNHPYYNDETQWGVTEGPGGDQVVAMHAGQQDSGAEGGGAYTNAVTIDSSKTYEFVYYFKLDTIGTHSVYFGTNLGTTGAYVEDASTGADATNPYFFTRGYGQQTIFTADKWYKVVGYVLAEGSALVPQGSLGGVYDVETGDLVAATTGVYRWNAGRPDNQVYSRFFNADNQGVQGYSTYFYKPEIREVGAPIPVTPETSTSHYRYDNLGRLRMTVDPLGRATYMIYDAVGRKVADVDADGSVVEYRYDGSDRHVSTIRYATRLTAAELASLADFDSGGDGSSATLGITGASHLDNGGFDESGDPVTLPTGRSNTWLPGWTKANGQNFEQVAAGQWGVTGTTGAYWLDLDSVAGTGAPVQIGSNLITNGSFDTSGSYTALAHGRLNSSLPGWTKTNSQGFEQVAAGQFGVTGATGSYWLDLDSYVAGSTRIATGANLLTNGSFESLTGAVKVQYGWTSNNMPGWTRIGPARFEVHNSTDPDVTASDGSFWLDLDSTYTDSSGGPPPEIMGQYVPFGGMGTNQLVNGSFEDVHEGNPASEYGYFGFALAGWENLSGVRADQIYSGELGIDASHGAFWLDLDGPSGAAANLDIAQTLTSLIAGNDYLLQFDHANRTTGASGSFEVYWNNELIATINDTGTTMVTEEILLTAITGDNVLRFRGTGIEDQEGASLDNVRLMGDAALGEGWLPTDPPFVPILKGGGGGGPVTTPANAEISQTISGRTAGEIMEIRFDHANRTTAASGSFEVYWNDELIASIDSTGTTMQTKTYQVAAVAGNNTLRFKGTGTEDNFGASIDKVGVYATELVATGGNMDISQVVPSLAAGQAMQIQFDHANRTTGASGSFEVYWNGTLLETINSTGTAMQTKTYNVTAIAGNNTLRFKGTGTVDASGASIDNVRLYATQPDVGGGNMDVSQTVHDLTAGQVMRLQFDHANRTTAASGGFEVWWNGNLVATITDTGSAMQAKSYDLIAVAGNNALRFKGIGAVDAAGASIDNVRLFTTQAIGGTGAGSLGVKLADVRPDATANDAWTWNVYDAAGRLIQDIDGTGATTTYAYDGASRLVSARSYANRLSAATITALKAAAVPTLNLPATDAGDRVVRSFHDNDGRLIGTLDGEGSVTRTVYDKAGRKIETVAYAGSTSAALRANGTLDQLAVSAGIDDARNIHNYFVYDARGFLRATIDGEGDLTRYAYTPLGDVAETVTGQKLDPAELLITKPTLANLPEAPSGTVLQTISYARNPYGQILTETRSLTAGTSTVTTYNYDNMRRLVSTTTQSGGPDARTETRRYDVRGRLTGELSGIGSALLAALGPNPDAELVDPIWADHGTLYSYDAADRLVATSDANGARLLFYYDVDGKLVYQVGALGEVVEYRYDALGNRTDAISHAARIDFETLGEMVGGAASDVAGTIAVLASAALDQATHVEFNVDGTIRQSTDPLGELTTYTYNAFGELVVQSNPINAGTVVKTSFAYDHRGQVTTQIVDSALGGKAITTLFGYDAFGRAVQLTDPNGHVTATGFDRAGRVTSTVDALSNTTVFAYDARGNLAAVVDAMDHVTRYVYDHAGRKIFAVDALGGVVETSYDGDGRVLATRAYAVAVSSFGWGLEIAAGDVSAQLTASAGDRVTRNAYDEDGRLQFVVDGNLGLTEYRHDDVGNAVRTIGYDWTVSSASTFTLDALQAEVDAHEAYPKRVTVAVYDLAGRLTFSVDATGNVASFTYDSAGRLIRQVAFVVAYGTGDVPPHDVMQDWATNNTHADDRTSRAVYDRKGRLVYSIDAEGFVTEYRYNKLDGVVKEIRYVDPYGVADGATVASVAALIGPLPATAIATDFVYDSAARLVETVDGLGHRTVMTLDQRGQTVSITEAYGTGDAVTTTRLYDAVGRIMSESRADGTADEQTTAYGYNALGELVLIASAAGTSAERVTMRKYDGLGRVTGELSGIGGALIAALGPNPDEELIDPIWAEYGTLFGYDAAGHLTGKSDANGARTLYYYDTADRLAFEVDAVGGVVEHRYNALGDRTETIRYAARIDSETLSEMVGGAAAAAAGIVTALAASSLDGSTVSTYDAAGRLILSAGQLGVYTAYDYNSFGEVKLRRTALDVGTEIATSFAYDRRGKLETEIVDSAVGGKAITTGHGYDAFGREIALTDPNNHGTATVYDRAGRVESITDALGQPVSFIYDARGNVVAVEDALGHLTRYVYDRLDHMVFAVDALGGVVAYSHDGAGQVVVTRAYADAISLTGLGLQITAANVTGQLGAGSADDRITRNAYDQDGRLRFTVDGAAGLTEYRYDDIGNVIRTVRYGWTVSTSTYTIDGLQAEVDAHAADPMRVTRAVHDGAGRMTFSIDATGKVTAFTYDSAGRVIRQIVLATAYETDEDPLNDVMQGWAAASAHADDRISRAVYDREGRLVYSIDAESFVTEYRRNRSGEVILQIRYPEPVPVADGATPASVAALLPSSVPQSASTTEYFYDSAGRLEKTKDAIGAWTVMTLDQRGQILSTTLAHGTSDAATTTRSYDELGRLETETRGQGSADATTIVYGYDEVGNLTAITYAAGTADQCVTTRTYDTAGRLETETRAAGSGEQVTTTYGYNAFGDVETIRAASGTADEQLTTRLYDARGRLESETVADGTAAEATTTYVYNAFGNVAKITDPRLNSAYFYYDGLDRLVLQVDAEGYVTETVFGMGSEPESLTRYATQVQGATITAPPQIIVAPLADATTTFHYDKLDRLTDITDAEEHSEHYTLDALGNRTRVVNKLGGITDYTYDQIGRMKTQYVDGDVYRADGTLLAAGVQTDFVYDKRGNLKSKTEAVGLGFDERLTTYTYDKLDRLIEIDRPNISSVTVGLYMDFVSFDMKDSFAYDRRGNLIMSAVAGAPKSYAYFDHLNRKTDEIDQSGMFSHWTYDANGNVESQKVFDETVAFAGTRPSAPPGLVYPANFRETNFSYDGANRVLTSSSGSLTTGRWTGSAYAFDTGAIVRHVEYDAAGNMIRDSIGDAEIRSFYDKTNRQIAQIDAEGYLTVWERDSEGNVLTETRHAAKVTGTVAQDASIAQLHAAAGSSTEDRVTAFTYDANGRRLTEKRLGLVVYSISGVGALSPPESLTYSEIHYQYNAFGQVTHKIEANGDETVFQYDDQGRLEKVTAPGFNDQTGTWVSPTTQNQFDSYGNIVRSTVNKEGGLAANARVTTYSYNSMGWVQVMTDPTAASHTYFHDAGGRVVLDRYTRTKSPGTNVTEGITYTYDIAGRLISQAMVLRGTQVPPAAVKWSFGDTTHVVYNVHGDMIARGVNHDTSGNPIYQETFDYDAGGRLWRSTAGDGTVKFMFYDTRGNATLTLSSTGAALGGLSFTQARTSIDGAGDTNIQDAVSTIAMFDKRGQQIATIEPDRTLVAGASNVAIARGRGYNAFGEVTSETDGRNNTTHFFYNAMGRLIRKESPLVSWTNEAGLAQTGHPTEHYFYDVSGRMIAVTDANGYTTRRHLLAGTGHDGTEALVTVEFHADTNKAQTLYDVFKDARIQRNEYWVDANSNTNITDMLLDYDKAGRLVQVQNRGRLLTDLYTYDQLGQRLSHTLVRSGQSDITERTEYDRQGRVVTQVDFGGDATISTTSTTTYVWDSTLVTAGLGSFGGWVKTTINAAGRTMIEKTDFAGRMIGSTDLGGHVFSFSYDLGGRAVGRTGSTGENVTFGWFNTGLMSSTSFGAGNASAYGYDVDGHRTLETTQVNSKMVQNATAQYDVLGRMTRWEQTNIAAAGGSLGVPGATLLWTYDLNGNIRSRITNYHTINLNGVASPTASGHQEDWYRYDAMNRFTVTKGVVGAEGVWQGDLGIGVFIEYDEAGQRKQATRTLITNIDIGEDHTFIIQRNLSTRESYSYDAAGYLFEMKLSEDYYQPNIAEPNDEGVVHPAAALRARYTRDAMGRVSMYEEFIGAPNATQVVFSRATTYNDRSQATSEELNRKVVNGTHFDVYKDVTTNYYNAVETFTGSGVWRGVAAGGTYMGGTVTASTTKSYVDLYSQLGGFDDGDAPDTATTNSLVWWDSAQQSRIEHDTDTGPGGSLWDTSFSYDISGHIASASIDDGRDRNVVFITDSNGLVLQRKETDTRTAASEGDPRDINFYFNGIKIGDISNNGTTDVDYVTTLIGHRFLPANPGLPFRNNTWSGESYADFDQSYDVLNGDNWEGTGSHYTVQEGDTLQSVALGVWGDSAMWYLLAEANGLTSASQLAAGTTLTIPNKVVNAHNNSSTFQVYDPNKALGDLSPTNPKPKKQSQGCGMMGQILILVVAAALTIALPHIAPVIFASGALGGFGAVATAVVASAVSQGVAIATGQQAKFSWKSLGLAAITAGVGAGLDKLNVFAKIGVAGSKFGAQLAQGAISSTLSQGIAVATGLQKKFDFVGVAASAVGQAVSSQIKVGGRGGKFLRTAADAFSDAAVRSLINGTSFGDNVIAALPSVIGRTVGDIVGESVSLLFDPPEPAPTIQPQPAAAEPAPAAAATAPSGGAIRLPSYLDRVRYLDGGEDSNRLQLGASATVDLPTVSGTVTAERGWEWGDPRTWSLSSFFEAITQPDIIVTGIPWLRSLIDSLVSYTPTWLGPLFGRPNQTQMQIRGAQGSLQTGASAISGQARVTHAQNMAADSGQPFTFMGMLPQSNVDRLNENYQNQTGLTSWIQARAMGEDPMVVSQMRQEGTRNYLSYGMGVFVLGGQDMGTGAVVRVPDTALNMVRGAANFPSDPGGAIGGIYNFVTDPFRGVREAYQRRDFRGMGYEAAGVGIDFFLTFEGGASLLDRAGVRRGGVPSRATAPVELARSEGSVIRGDSWSSTESFTYPATPPVDILRQNNRRGNQFERDVISGIGEHVGISKNGVSRSMMMMDGSIVSTIVDIDNRIVGMVEIKDVINLSNSRQLRAQAQYARESRTPLNLIVSPRNRSISAPLREQILRTGGGIYRYSPATGRLETLYAPRPRTR